MKIEKEEYEQDVIDIMYEYDEDRGNILTKDAREYLKMFYKDEEKSHKDICNVIFKKIDDSELKKKVEEMLISYKELIKDEMGYLCHIYYRQGYKCGATVVKDSLLNNE